MNNEYHEFSMRIFFFALVCVQISGQHALAAKIIEKCVTVSFIQERINGNRFAHRTELVDGVRTELWAVNGSAVYQAEYDEAIITAELEECKAARQKECEKERKKQEELIALQRAGLMKLLKVYFDQLESIIKRFADPRLKPYLVFNGATLNQEQYQELINTLMPQIAKIIEGAEQLSIPDLSTLIAKVETYPERIEQLYWATVKNAQEQSNDTRLLKDLLSLTTEHLVD